MTKNPGHSERSRAMADLISEELRLSPAEANEVRWGAFFMTSASSWCPRKSSTRPAHRHRMSGPSCTAIPRGRPIGGAAAPLSRKRCGRRGCPPRALRRVWLSLHLSGEQIPLVARIVAVADSFEVMTAVRSYKRPMSAQAARQNSFATVGRSSTRASSGRS